MEPYKLSTVSNVPRVGKQYEGHFKYVDQKPMNKICITIFLKCYYIKIWKR